MSGAVIGHVMKRGVAAARDHFQQASPEYIAQLQHDAELYEDAGPGNEVKFEHLLPVIITGIIVMLVIASVRYTIGDVMASLAMIEAPSSTAVIEPKPPAYADEPDAPLEKEPLIPSEAEADVEVTVVNHKPITSSVRGTIRHLGRVGGFAGRWRGIRTSVVYHMLHAFLTNILAHVFMVGPMFFPLMYILVSVLLAKVHMMWTHNMIAHPSSKPFWRRGLEDKKRYRSLFMPALVYAAAEQATLILPMLVLAFIDPASMQETAKHAHQNKECGKMVMMGLKMLAVPATALFVAVAVLLPASVTLTRIEATLLPEDQPAIVPFDAAAIVGDIDTTVRGGPKALFVQAWRSFDRSARLRLIKLYVKMIFIQLAVGFVGIHLMMAEVYLIGGEKLAVFMKSAHAQVKLMMIEAQQNAQNVDAN